MTVDRGKVGMNRRRFLQVLATSTGGMLIGTRVLAQDLAWLPLELLGAEFETLGPYLRIEPDGRIFIGARAPDMGQGTHTALTRMIADEFDADWTKVSVVPMRLAVVDIDGEVRFKLGPQDARGSTSMAQGWDDMRRIGANARARMLRAAANVWRTRVADLHCEQSKVIAADGRTLAYGELAARAAAVDLDDTGISLKAPRAFDLIGQPAGDVDALAMVTGQQRYSIDRQLGDALVAVIARCPYLDGRMAHVDESAALAVPGVVKLLRIEAPDGSEPLGTAQLAAGVAVLATSTWAALMGREALKIDWQQRRWADHSSAALASAAEVALAQPTSGVVVRRDGDVDAVFADTKRTLEASYQLPFLAHVTMEPLCCLVRLNDEHVEIEAATQDPGAVLAVVQRLTGLSASAIDIRFPRMGGGFGRRLDSDHVAEAVLLAQAAGEPIKLMWTREDDLVHDLYRPFAVHHLRAALDRQGELIGWRHQLASTSKNARRGIPPGQLWMSEMYPDALPAGMIENLELLWHGLETGVGCGNWRAPGHNSLAFAVECFLDEIAHKGKRDPLELRLQLLGEPRTLPYRGFGGPTFDTGRMAKVLQLAADTIEWTHRRRNGNGLGIACHYTFGSYAAHAFEVSIRQGKLRFHRAVCAVDVGRVINPLGVDAQIAGATIDGLSAALRQAITIKHGQVQQTSLDQYRMARSADMPRKIEVITVDSERDPTGAGEVGLPSAAPALANAIFAASTVRIRRLPLLPELERLL